MTTKFKICLLLPNILQTSVVCMCEMQEKCYQYWPEQGCWIYGCVRVAMEDVTVLVDYTIRKFCVQHVSGHFPQKHYTIIIQMLCILCSYTSTQILLTCHLVAQNLKYSEPLNGMSKECVY